MTLLTKEWLDETTETYRVSNIGPDRVFLLIAAARTALELQDALQTAQEENERLQAVAARRLEAFECAYRRLDPRVYDNNMEWQTYCAETRTYAGDPPDAK